MQEKEERERIDSIALGLHETKLIDFQKRKRHEDPEGLKFRNSSRFKQSDLTKFNQDFVHQMRDLLKHHVPDWCIDNILSDKNFSEDNETDAEDDVESGEDKECGDSHEYTEKYGGQGVNNAKGQRRILWLWQDSEHCKS